VRLQVADKYVFGALMIGIDEFAKLLENEDKSALKAAEAVARKLHSDNTLGSRTRMYLRGKKEYGVWFQCVLAHVVAIGGTRDSTWARWILSDVVKAEALSEEAQLILVQGLYRGRRELRRRITSLLTEVGSLSEAARRLLFAHISTKGSDLKSFSALILVETGNSSEAVESVLRKLMITGVAPVRRTASFALRRLAQKTGTLAVQTQHTLLRRADEGDSKDRRATSDAVITLEHVDRLCPEVLAELRSRLRVLEQHTRLWAGRLLMSGDSSAAEELLVSAIDVENRVAAAGRLLLRDEGHGQASQMLIELLEGNDSAQRLACLALLDVGVSVDLVRRKLVEMVVRKQRLGVWAVEQLRERDWLDDIPEKTLLNMMESRYWWYRYRGARLLLDRERHRVKAQVVLAKLLLHPKRFERQKVQDRLRDIHTLCPAAKDVLMDLAKHGPPKTARDAARVLKDRGTQVPLAQRVLRKHIYSEHYDPHQVLDGQ
jgi:hypothetical protein